MLKRFLFATDHHWGYSRKGGHKVPTHDEKAWNTVLDFARDFKPHVFILGGDTIDAGAVSHHNKGKPGRTEGLKLLADTEECYEKVIKPIEALKPERMAILLGNHCQWIADVVDDIPALEGIVDIRKLLHLDKWEVIEQGEAFNLGKLTFVHGDQLKGGENVAKNAVIAYERSIRFGHHHTYAAYSKTSPLDYKLGKTGIAVPCLCLKDPSYGKGAPNKWLQGFNYGYIDKKGNYNDAVAIILDGKTVIGGKTYRG